MTGQDIGGRYLITLPSTTGRNVCAEFRIRRDTVEVWYQDRCQAVMDRDLFRIWLERNPGPYVVDDVMWTLTPGQPVALVIRDSGCWLIPPDLIAGLRARV
jgi:hypothetical protein